MDLQVVLTREVEPEALREQVETTLQELLDLRSRPRIELRGTAGGAERIGAAGQSWMLAVPETAQASLMMLDLPHDESAPATTKRTAVISRGERNHASAALAIAAGIALARHAGTTLIDDAHLLSGSGSSEPETLLAAIRLRQPQDDLDGAAHRLLSARGL